MSRISLGIVGLGVCLPCDERTNDWWPDAVTRAWKERPVGRMWSGRRDGDVGGGVRPEGPEEVEVAEAMAALRSDPFRGAQRRRVADASTLSSDLEVEAARRALADAGVEPDAVDFIIVQSVNPDHLGVPNACIVHRRLELRSSCTPLSTQGMCNDFQVHLSLAEQRLARFPEQVGLLVQSCVISPLLDPADPSSAVFGDAATAVVVRGVAAPTGLEAQVHGADTSMYPSVVFGVPGRRWHDEGPVRTYLADLDNSRRMIYACGRIAGASVREALSGAGVAPEAVDVYAAHQPAPWFGALTQRAAGLAHARAEDTFTDYANCVACNLPLVLDRGRQRGTLEPGDRVVLFSAAPGITWTASVLVWGAQRPQPPGDASRSRSSRSNSSIS